MKDIKAVIFDLDGTILDTLDDLMLSTNRALQAHGFPVRQRHEIRRFIGHGIEHLIRESLPTDVSQETFENVFQYFKADYLVHASDHTRPYEGILDVMTCLQKRYQLAVVSNKTDPAVKALCAQYFAGMFDVIVGERPDVRKKPAPDSLNEVMKRLHVAKHEVLYVGDSEVDIKTSQNADVPLLLVGWGFRDYEELTAYHVAPVILEPGELLLYLEASSSV